MQTEALSVTSMTKKDFFKLCRKPFSDCGLNIDTMTFWSPVTQNFYRVGSSFDFSEPAQEKDPSKALKEFLDYAQIKDYHEFHHHEICELLAVMIDLNQVPMSDFVID